MANKEFAKYAADQSWETNGGDFENAPDGVYTGKFEFVEVKKSGSAFWMLVMKFLITAAEEEEGAPFIGKSHFVNLMFEGKNGWNPWKVKAFFKEIGVELPEFKQVEATLQELIDNNTGFIFEIKTKNDFTNTKILEVLEDFNPDVEGAGGGEEESTSDLPSEEDIDGMSKEEIIVFAEEHEIELGTKILSKMKAAVKTWVEENTPDEDVETGSESDLPSEEDVNAMSKEDLVAFAEEHGIELNTKITSKMKAAVKAWIAENSSSEDGDASEEDATKEKFVEFAASHGIEDIDDDTSMEDIKEVLGELTFNEDELTDEEKELLNENELGECIVKPKKSSAKPTAKKK